MGTPGFSRAAAAERAAEMVAAVVNGETPADVARRFNVTRGRVYAACRARGLILRYSDRVGHFGELAARRRLVILQAMRGATHREITASLGLKEDSIRDICANAGVRLRPVRGARAWEAVPVYDATLTRAAPFKQTSQVARRRAERDQLLAESVKGGLSAAQAATRFNVSVSTVYGVLRASGLGTPSRPLGSTRSLREAVLQLAARGNDVHAIAGATGRSESYVRTLCNSRGVKLQTRADRVEAARVLARHRSLRGVDTSRLLGGRHAKVLRLLRDTSMTLREIAGQVGYSPRGVFDVWTSALHRLAVPNEGDHRQLVAARRRVMSSGISLHALGKGKHEKLLRAMRDSELSLPALARNARMSQSAVWHIWFLALDRAAIADARVGPIPPKWARRKRRTNRGRKLLRDLIL